MRILLASANFRPRVGGIERFTENLAAGLAGRGHDVTVLCCRERGAPPSETIGGFGVVRVPASQALNRLGLAYPLPEPRGLLLALRRELETADVLHVQDALYLTSVAALAVARRRRVPSVLTQHVAFVPQGSRLLDAAERAAVATLGRAARLATLPAALNPEVGAWAARTWRLDGVRTLPVGVPEPAPDEDRDAVRRRLGLPPDVFVALFVGRDVPKKGLDLFLAAADPAYHLVAVTDRPASGAAGLTVLPFMPAPRLHALMAAADALVLPSEAEGMPVVLQEALVSGLPVVTTYQRGYERHLAADDVVVVERTVPSVRGAISSLARDEALRSRLAARALAAGRRSFSFDAFLTAYEDAYAEAIARERG